jgi:hypothetical protein
MLEPKVMIVFVSLHTENENPSATILLLLPSNLTCTIKTATAEISNFNSTNENIIQIFMAHNTVHRDSY